MSLLLLLSGAAGIPPPPPIVGPVRLDSAPIVELALAGSYYNAVLANDPIGLWLLNEQRSTTGARDISGNNRHGTYDNGGTFGQLGPFPHGGTAMLFNGTTHYVSLGDVAAFEFTGEFSVGILFKTTTSASGVMGLIGKHLTATQAGWGVTMTADGKIRFAAFTSAPAAVFDVTTDAEYDDGLYHHCVCVWNGTTAADQVKIFIDGVQVKTGTASAGTPATNTARLLIGARDNAGTPVDYFVGTLSAAVVYDGAIGSGAVASHFNTTQWTNVTADVVSAAPGLVLEYGTNGTGPLNRLANAGVLDFGLRNSAMPPNSAGLRGYYSPLHANCRAGFTFNIPVRVSLTYDGTTRTKFWGRLAVIDPEPGQRRSQITHCLAHDYMHTLVDTDVRSIQPQLGQTDVDLIRTVFDALPYDVQPMALDLDPAVDTYTYAFDDIRGGVKAATALDKVLVSAWARGFVTGDGTFAMRNRNATTNQVIDFALDDDMLELESPSDNAKVFDHVRVVTHPKDVDATATSVLYSHPLKPFVAANGGRLEIWPEQGYRNPANDLMTVGGTDMVTPLASGTDFIANSAEDGSGTVLTGSVTVTASFFASTVKLTLTNNHATLGAYFTTLQVRGKGIYDRAPVTSEAMGTPGTRPITVDLPYQDDGNVGQEIADFILHEREVVTDPVESIAIDPQRGDLFMRLALDGEIGTLVTVSETQTGLAEAQAAIRSVRLEVSSGPIVQASLGLTPLVVGYKWILGDPVFSRLGETTVFG